MNKEVNVRLITIDSCRFDTAEKANTPALDSVSELRKAETHATFTYPAHHAFFIGNLPRLEGEGQKYIEGIDQIWRSTDARNTQKSVLQTFDGKNILEYYQRNGYNVWGYGGVGFFNTNVSSNSLPSMFGDNFRYFGPTGNLHPHQKVPRGAETLPLGNIEQIVYDVSGERPYFMFMNCPETHIPYDVPGTNTDETYLNLIQRVYREQNIKTRHNVNELPFSDEEIEFFKQQQVDALEWVDAQLAILFATLPKHFPALTIVMGDHGEEFGDQGRFGHAHNAETVQFVPVWADYEE